MTRCQVGPCRATTITIERKLSVDKTKNSTKSKISTETKQEDEQQWWSTEEKRRIGSICKTMMDVGRAFMFRDKGFAADIISYIDEETSMENRLLRVRAKKAMPNREQGESQTKKARPNEAP